MTTPRSSSPLNPNARSSSPLSSPTPGGSSSSYGKYQSFSAPIPLYKSSPSNRPSLSTRYIRPSKKSISPIPPSPSSTPGSGGSTNTDLFSEGTTPMEGLMWRERFSRRVEERERRKNRRNHDLDNRRGTTPIISREMSVEEQDEYDKKAQEDDEEIFRRLVILQRKKNQHATLISHEIETGGSDPLTPEFWEDELLILENEERELMRRLDGVDHPNMDLGESSSSSSYKMNGDQTLDQNGLGYSLYQGQEHDQDQDQDQEEWEREAALAEQQELETMDDYNGHYDEVEVEFANQVEQAHITNNHIHHYQQQQQHHHPHTMVTYPLGDKHGVISDNTDMEMDMGMDMEVDWEAFDSMDIE